MPDQAYAPPQKRPDEEQTAYVLRTLREEVRHGALMEAAAALRAVAASRQPPTWGANEALAWQDAASHVEGMIDRG